MPEGTTARPAPGALLRLSLVLGGAHAAVDACTVTSVYRSIDAHALDHPDAFALVVAYGLLAFATQLPIGALADRRGAFRGLLWMGLLLTGVGVLALPVHPLLVLAAAGLGNALFHVGAGALLLDRAPERAGPSGVFVGPGALGLAFGVWYGADAAAGPLWPLLLALAVAAAAVALARLPSPAPSPAPGAASGAPVGRTAAPRGHALRPWHAAGALVGLLFVAIAVRSYVGTGGPYALPRLTGVLLALPLAACLGKMLGGLLADRFGWLPVAVGSLAAAAPLLAFGGAAPALVVPGLLLFQMPMPIVLAATARLLPGRPATAFGVNCLALVLGALPTFHAWGRALYGPRTFFPLAALAAIAVWVALRRLPAAAAPAVPPPPAPAVPAGALRETLT
jgi:FSR family fosmidomycin resistance protein-like MFS transporter